MVELIHVHIRPADRLARLGGDEFALLMPETGPGGAAASLERLQGLVAREMAQRGWPLAVSMGAATFPRPPMDVDHMIQRVDALMYAAKCKGKGRIEHAVDEVGDVGGLPCWERRVGPQGLAVDEARIRHPGDEHVHEDNDV